MTNKKLITVSLGARAEKKYVATTKIKIRGGSYPPYKGMRKSCLSKEVKVFTSSIINFKVCGFFWSI